MSLSFTGKNGALAAAWLMVSGALMPSVGHAQAAVEWAGFVPKVDVPRLEGNRDLGFLAVSQEGPWQAATLTALGRAERELFVLMDAGKWQQALAWLKAERPELNRQDDTGRTPLSMAAREGDLALVKEMLRQGAELDRPGAGGWTPLGGAVFGGHELVVRELLQAGARVDTPSASGQPPLHLACATGHVPLVATLLDAGADWLQPNLQGRHAIEEAAYFGQLPVLQALQQRGLPLAQTDRYQLNAVHAAALGVQLDTLAWLQGQGVKVPSTLSQVLVDKARASAADVTP